MKKSLKYQLPDFVSATPLTQAGYQRWLHGRAVAHVKRDKKRGNTTATNETYKVAIHDAVIRSGGVDHYTGEPLNWALVGQYSNVESKAKKRNYKATLALLPSVDHVGDRLGDADFKSVRGERTTPSTTSRIKNLSLCAAELWSTSSDPSAIDIWSLRLLASFGLRQPVLGWVGIRQDFRVFDHPFVLISIECYKRIVYQLIK